jgi:hypothetical protein
MLCRILGSLSGGLEGFSLLGFTEVLEGCHLYFQRCRESQEEPTSKKQVESKEKVKMCSSETSIDFRSTTCCYTAADKTQLLY